MYRRGDSAVWCAAAVRCFSLRRLDVMKRLLVLFFAPLLARALPAQSSQCPSGTNQQRATQDACQQSIDLFKYMVPQLGIAITGGNATLGQGGALGGLGHFT